MCDCEDKCDHCSCSKNKKNKLFRKYQRKHSLPFRNKMITKIHKNKRTRSEEKRIHINEYMEEDIEY